MTMSIVSDERSSRMSLTRKLSSTTDSINLPFRRHFVVFGISTFESYSQRFFHFELHIFCDLLVSAMFVLAWLQSCQVPQLDPMKTACVTADRVGLCWLFSTCKAVKLERRCETSISNGKRCFSESKACSAVWDISRRHLLAVELRGLSWHIFSRKPHRTSLCFRSKWIRTSL